MAEATDLAAATFAPAVVDPPGVLVLGPSAPPLVDVVPADVPEAGDPDPSDPDDPGALSAGTVDRAPDPADPLPDRESVR
ncbi:MAG TPA: hypothetical protein VES01_06245 [Dermatophilaceae bacterium]|nr:hypothetical protein [Dermatophilaceae bacterium]